MFFYLPSSLKLDAYQTFQDNNKLSVASIIKEYLLAEKVDGITVITPQEEKPIHSLYDLEIGVEYELKFHDDLPHAKFSMTRTEFNKMTLHLHCTPPLKSSSEITSSDNSFDPDETFDCVVEGLELQSFKGEKLEFHQRARMQFNENSAGVSTGANSLVSSSSGSDGSGVNSSGSGGNFVKNGDEGSGDSFSEGKKVVSTAVDLDYSYGFVDGTFYVTNFRCVFVPYKFINTSKLVFQEMRYSGVVIGDKILNPNYMGTCVYVQDLAESEAAAWDNAAWLESLLLKNRPIWFPIKAISKFYNGNPPKGFWTTMWSYVSFTYQDQAEGKILRVNLSPYYRCTLYGTFFFIFENDVYCKNAYSAIDKGMCPQNSDGFPFKFGGVTRDDEPRSCGIRDYDVIKEFEREGLLFGGDGESDDKRHAFACKWRITDINKDYKVTKTYPKLL